MYLSNQVDVVLYLTRSRDTNDEVGKRGALIWLKIRNCWHRLFVICISLGGVYFQVRPVPFLSSQSRIWINRQLFAPSLVKQMQVRGNNVWHPVTHYIMIMAMRKKNSGLCFVLWGLALTLSFDGIYWCTPYVCKNNLPSEFCFWLSLTNFKIKSPWSWRELRKKLKRSAGCGDKKFQGVWFRF